MGLILPQMVKISINSSNCKHYREKGYKFEKCRESIIVNVLDLTHGSRVKVKAKCDFCGKEIEISYKHFFEYNEKNIPICCNNRICLNKKIKNSNMKKYGVESTNQLKSVQDKQHATCKANYGVEHPIQSKEIQDKIKKTNTEKYGVENALQCKQVQDKMKATNVERYGVEHPIQSKEIQDKIKKTNVERYGVENAMQNEIIQNKAKATNRERYGVEYVAQCEEIQKKMYNTLISNGNTIHCSKQQLHLANLLHGKLNIPLVGYWADIVLEENKIDLEYDGGGHRAICDFYHKITSEEFDLKERKREEKISEKGYRIIRIISKKDKLPSDEVILNLINSFIYSDFKVLKIDIDNNTIEKDYEKKWHCNFGKLKIIKKLKNKNKKESF